MRPLYSTKRLSVPLIVGIMLLTTSCAQARRAPIANPQYIQNSGTQMTYSVGNNIDFSMIDRRSGQQMPIYVRDGQYWVAGTAGQQYALRVTKRDAATRMLAVMSVDGVNIITGETASFLQQGYILSRNTPYDITGWRKSLKEVAAFSFGKSSTSYAAETGRPNHVGVIGIAVFPEKTENYYDSEAPSILSERPQAAIPAPAFKRGNLSQAGKAERTENSARKSPSPRREVAKIAEAQSTVSGAYTAEVTQSLGTQHGRRETSVTRNVAFTRASQAPAEVISIRYDSYENLVARGILITRAQKTAPTPFPEGDERGFTPDPPSR